MPHVFVHVLVHVLVLVLVLVNGNRAARLSEWSPMLDHERLDVYRRSLEFLATAFALSERVPRGYSALADQLRRAAMSIPLNIAEAGGKSEGPDRRRFYVIARGSAMECGAILDVIAVMDRLPSDVDEIAKGKELLLRIVEMLTRMRR